MEKGEVEARSLIDYYRRVVRLADDVERRVEFIPAFGTGGTHYFI